MPASSSSRPAPAVTDTGAGAGAGAGAAWDSPANVADEIEVAGAGTPVSPNLDLDFDLNVDLQLDPAPDPASYPVDHLEPAGPGNAQGEQHHESQETQGQGHEQTQHAPEPQALVQALAQQVVKDEDRNGNTNGTGSSSHREEERIGFVNGDFNGNGRRRTRSDARRASRRTSLAASASDSSVQENGEHTAHGTYKGFSSYSLLFIFFFDFIKTWRSVWCTRPGCLFPGSLTLPKLSAVPGFLVTLSSQYWKRAPDPSRRWQRSFWKRERKGANPTDGIIQRFTRAVIGAAVLRGVRIVYTLTAVSCANFGPREPDDQLP